MKPHTFSPSIVKRAWLACRVHGFMHPRQLARLNNTELLRLSHVGHKTIRFVRAIGGAAKGDTG